MYTGRTNIDLVRQYESSVGYSYITYNDTSFDGFDDATWEYVSPWAEEVALTGTDGVQNAPGLDDDSEIQVYVSTGY